MVTFTKREIEIWRYRIAKEPNGHPYFRTLEEITMICPVSRIRIQQILERTEMKINKLIDQHMERDISSDPFFTEKEAKVWMYRHAIIDGKYHTLEEAGKKFGVTRERIRQMEKRFLDGILKIKKMKEEHAKENY